MLTVQFFNIEVFICCLKSNIFIKNMNHYCCVPHCSSWAKKNPEISFHTFPKTGKSRVIVETKLGNKELMDRRKVWIKNLKIGKLASEHMRECCLHFTEQDYFPKESPKQRILKSNAVPTKKLPLVPEAEAGPSSRDIRSSGSRHSSVRFKENNSIDEVESISISNVHCKNNTEEEEESPDDKSNAVEMLTLLRSQSHSNIPKFRNAGVQVNTPKALTLCELIITDDKLSNFTGVNNFQVFDTIVKMFENYYKDKRVHRLSSR